jgi:hypothetical protein
MGRVLSNEQLKTAEDWAFYESGLSAHGCLEKLDSYTKKSIERYGRCLLNHQANRDTKTENEELKKISRSLYGVVLHVYALAKEDALVLVGPELFKEAANAVKQYEEIECEHL